MKISVMAVGLAATTIVAGVAVAGCGNNKSSTASSSPASSSSSSSKPATSSAAGAQPTDYASLLIKASDIQAPGDTFTMQQPQINPNGKPGVAASFANQDGTRQIGDTILVLPSASDAAGSLDATKTAAAVAVSGGTTQPADVGTGGTTITGTSPDGSKAVTILLFTEGKSIVTLEFDSAANDPVPPDFVTDIGQKQDAAIKAGLPA
jgi:hypothetical protein